MKIASKKFIVFELPEQEAKDLLFFLDENYSPEDPEAPDSIRNMIWNLSREID